jgi:ATP-dependent Lhr-like helicase
LSPALPEVLAAWFAGRGWQVRRHQLEMLAAVRGGSHALLMADTGSGKTLAGFLPTLADAVEGGSARVCTPSMFRRSRLWRRMCGAG